MNWDRIEGNWKQFKGKVKVQWGKLTDDPLDVIAGKRDKLAGKIQETYGISRSMRSRPPARIAACASSATAWRRAAGCSDEETARPRLRDASIVKT